METLIVGAGLTVLTAGVAIPSVKWCAKWFVRAISDDFDDRVKQAVQPSLDSLGQKIDEHAASQTREHAEVVGRLTDVEVSVGQLTISVDSMDNRLGAVERELVKTGDSHGAD